MVRRGGGSGEDLVAAIGARLAAAGCVAAEDEAIELADAAPAADELESWVRRRERGEPLAWITGSLRFCGHDIRVGPGVYVPKLQTEELARRAADRLAGARGHGATRALDLCTGAGAVAVHLMAACPDAAVIGVDADPRALRCARENGVPSVRGDLEVDGPPFASRSFDVVTAVAPYVPTGELHLLPADVVRYEPLRALDGGVDGLRLVRRIVASAARLVRRRGWLLLEVGGEQDDALAGPLEAAGFGSVESWADEDGDLRGVAARLSAEHEVGGRV